MNAKNFRRDRDGEMVDSAEACVGNMLRPGYTMGFDITQLSGSPIMVAR
jgi:hypothetical protein